MNIPIFEIVLGENEGVTMMSLVESPAVESDFIAFSKEEPMKFSVDNEQHIVFGPALRANYPIYRRDAFGREYYVVFSEEVIRQLYEKFMREGLTSKVNLEHSVDTSGVYLIQSFLKDTAKGISPIGFEDVEDGSWFCAYKVDNDDVWEGVKAGTFNGFSVEVFCDLAPTNDQIVVEDEMSKLIDELLQ